MRRKEEESKERGEGEALARREETRGSERGIAAFDPWQTMREYDTLFNRLASDMDRMFWGLTPRYMFRDLPATGALATIRTPLVDTRDTGKEYVVTAEMPGVPKDAVEMEVEDDRLVLRAEHSEEKEERGEEGSWMRRERRSTSFHRVVPFPEEVDVDRVRASMTDGVLNVRLPKVKPKESRGRKVKID